MPWNEGVSIQLHIAFDEGNVVEFKRLLGEHPEHLRDESGADYWMYTAALNRNLPILKAVVEMGVDVNETHDFGDPTSPFYEPEGPILTAASFGDLEMVRWLLNHGARINYVVQGNPRCLPLIRAATVGHLEVVKLLVAHGADVHSTWNGLNAMTQAEEFGRRDILDYLRSLKSPD